ncbi:MULTISPECIES: hypothetical protein [Bizionia]|uniref:Uncharacterized protein n=1 Tax=Bizionia algoritergicola TaxID=291187 RepID=A0A5D0QWE2_9FLAO|nr:MULTISPECIES: hypothetical protein [Bizionia]OBX22901.1 hypothetical protein BAA08_06380 [Bizionia sp. APA-3]TYB72788.1 hypothetical protein ES675_09585 [Bizionia algoritergicola]
MAKYSSSSSYSNYEAVIASFMILGIGIALTDSLEMIWMKALSIIVSVGIITWIILYRRKNTFVIKFKEDGIVIEYTFTKQTIFFII